jgi:RNA polymerase sigma-70 factor, ECF subfamily
MPEASTTAGVAAPDDETLVGLARQGNRQAREDLFQRHRGVAYRVAFRLLGNHQDAEDAVQDGLIKAFSRLEDFDGRSGFRTWLVRIVCNAAIDAGRKRGRLHVFKLKLGGDPARGEPEASDDPAIGLVGADLRRALDAALARLSPTVRTTFVLFAEAELSYKEIAEAQNVPIGTVMSRLHYARQKLQASPEIRELERT